MQTQLVVSPDPLVEPSNSFPNKTADFAAFLPEQFYWASISVSASLDFI